MTTDGIPEETTPAARRPAQSPRSTLELIVELQVRATAFTLAAIAVVNRDVTQFVFAIDDDPLGKLNALIGAGGHPIGLVGARIGGGIVDTTPNRLPSIRTTPTRWPICRPSASPS